MNYKTIIRWKYTGKYVISNIDLHYAKHLAGWAFQRCRMVNSVAVADETGKVELYLNRNRPRDVWVGV